MKVEINEVGSWDKFLGGKVETCFMQLEILLVFFF